MSDVSYSQIEFTVEDNVIVATVIIPWTPYNDLHALDCAEVKFLSTLALQNIPMCKENVNQDRIIIRMLLSLNLVDFLIDRYSGKPFIILHSLFSFSRYTDLLEDILVTYFPRIHSKRRRKEVEK